MKYSSKKMCYQKKYSGDKPTRGITIVMTHKFITPIFPLVITNNPYVPCVKKNPITSLLIAPITYITFEVHILTTLRVRLLNLMVPIVITAMVPMQITLISWTST